MSPASPETTESLRRETVRRYAAVHPAARWSLPLKWRLGRFDVIERLVPREGRVVDLGCGTGCFLTYLALASEKRACVGVDISDRKLAVAREATRGLWSVSFHLHNLFSYRPEDAACVTILDTLHYFDPAAQAAALENCAKHLAPGGALILRNIDREPRWTFRWNYAHEWAMTRVQLTATERAWPRLHFLPFAEYRSILERLGMEVEIVPPPQARPYAVTILSARKR